MKKNRYCSVCDKKLEQILNLNNHPCADTFLKNKKASLSLKKYPLEVGFCKCNHLTSINEVSPYERYEKNNYSYTSDNSPVSRSHFHNIAKKIIKYFKLKKNSSIIEIGSNDGTFLRNIKELSNADVLGVDPSSYMCKLAKKKGVKTASNFFNYKTSKYLKKKYKSFDILYGANVFNHVDNPKDFLRGCKEIVKKDGMIILEVPDLESLFDRIGFDTIYHEHRQYFSKDSIIKILHKTNLKLKKIEKIDYMSGSLRFYVKNCRAIKIKIKNRQKKHLKNFIKFKKNISLVKIEIMNFINKCKKNNQVLVGLGAATKGNTLLNYCNLKDTEIKCILENSKYKIGKFTPGSGIPIVDEKKFKKYNAILILPWNITSHLYKKFLQNTKISYTSIAKIASKVSKLNN
jgi:ubiquinone/menaquinone biosynthesis C-methylase UbiE